MSIARNASCPCGSGKKYKLCCGVAGAPPPPILDEAGEPIRRAWKLPAFLFILAIAAGVIVGQLRQAVQDGLSVSLALLVVVLGYVIIRKPPGSTGRGGGANIDYGMNPPRRQARSNRSARRRR